MPAADGQNDSSSPTTLTDDRGWNVPRLSTSLPIMRPPGYAMALP